MIGCVMYIDPLTNVHIRTPPVRGSAASCTSCIVHLSTDLVLFEGLEAFFKVRTVSCVANGLVCIGPAQSWF